MQLIEPINNKEISRTGLAKTDYFDRLINYFQQYK